jgi:uncharacterized RDD family membrane protein YckC
LDYDYEKEPEEWQPVVPAVVAQPAGQQALFQERQVDRRVIPFDQLTTPEERESIRARGAEISRPAPIKTTTVEGRRPRTQKRRQSESQHTLPFQTPDERRTTASLPNGALIAPPTLRMRAASIDVLLCCLGMALCFGTYLVAGGTIPGSKPEVVAFAAALLTVPALYRLIWVWAGQDSPGMQRTGLRLVDFGGHPPSRTQRYMRLAGSLVSVFAAGMGLIWAYCDPEELTWHDHMSGTYPSIDSED